MALRSIAFACVLFAAVVARASASDVYVDIEACVPEARDEVLRLVHIELGARVQAQPSPDALHVMLTCSADSAEIAVHTADQPARRRTIELASTPPELRPRILALQIAELVQQAPVAAPVIAPPAPEAAKPPASAPPPAESSARYELQAHGLAAAFERDGRVLLGAGLSFEGCSTWLCLGADAALATRSDRSALGGDRIVLGYLAPRAAALLALDPLRIQLGAGHAFGFAHIEATQSATNGVPGNVSGPWLAPFALADFGILLTRALAVHARGRLGYVIVPVVGRVARGADVEVRGLWLEAQLGLGHSF